MNVDVHRVAAVALRLQPRPVADVKAEQQWSAGTQHAPEVAVWKLDRLGRSTKDVLTIAEDLHARGVSLRILTGTLAGSYSPKGEGKFFFTMMVAFAELERDMIVERTRAGLDAAKAQGRTGGRPTVMDADKLAAAKARKAKGQSVTAIAEGLNVSRATLYRALADTE